MEVRVRVFWFLVNVRAYVADTVLHDLGIEKREMIFLNRISTSIALVTLLSYAC